MQDKGFSNKQIKLIIKSPELLVDSNDETALTNIIPRENINPLELAREISLNLQEGFLDELIKKLDDNSECSIQMIEKFKR